MGLLQFTQFHIHPWSNIDYSSYDAFEMSTMYLDSPTEYIFLPSDIIWPVEEYKDELFFPRLDFSFRDRREEGQVV